MGLIVSHVASSLSDHCRVPPPELLMAIVWLAGFCPPGLATKLKFEGLRAMITGISPVGVTYRCTGIVWGLLIAPGAEIVTIAL